MHVAGREMRGLGGSVCLWDGEGEGLEGEGQAWGGPAASSIFGHNLTPSLQPQEQERTPASLRAFIII